MDLSKLCMCWLLAHAVACVGTPKCDDDAPCDDEQQTVDNEGEACLVDVQTAPYGTGVSINAGETLTVRVAFDDCAPCGEDLSNDCSISASGTVLTVDATSSWTPVEGDCTTACNAWYAECTTPGLDAGSYTLSYGNANASFTVPSTGELVCAAAG